MSKESFRDRVALAALTGLLAAGKVPTTRRAGLHPHDAFTFEAYDIADSFLALRSINQKVDEMKEAEGKAK